ncbi:MAG: S-layer homology domain-containing protein, partial [Butyricicoccus sp.]|nr:S-layer homology domain-containing protein [Butyricicoccus sp.]
AACLPEKYDLYSVSTQDMANELDQITRKYNLRLHTSVTDFDSEDTLYSLLNAEPFLTDCTAVSGYIYEDGSFQPDKTVSRAEMAKMIYVLRTNGGTDAATYAEKMSTNFNDVNNHWASGYIKYCYAYGIVAGKSSTVFAPDAPVTTVEAAKMLLVYSGVDAAQSGLTGAQWKANTMKLADQDGLLKGVEADIDAPLPRQYAAQMIYNELAYSL